MRVAFGAGRAGSAASRSLSGTTPLVSHPNCNRGAAPAATSARRNVPSRARFVGVFLDAVVQPKAAPPKDLPVGPTSFASVTKSSSRACSATAISTRSRSIPSRFRTACHRHRSSGTVCSTASQEVGDRSCSAGRCQQRIRAAFDRLLDEYRASRGLELPISVKLASAVARPHPSSTRDDRSMRR